MPSQGIGPTVCVVIHRVLPWSRFNDVVKAGVWLCRRAAEHWADEAPEQDGI